MLRAAELRMVILVDGFIMTNCILAASRLLRLITFGEYLFKKTFSAW